MSGAEGQFYYFDQARNRQGPYAEAEFLRLMRDGAIGPETMVWYPELPDWRAAGHIDKFAPLFAGRPAPPPPPIFETGQAIPPARAMPPTGIPMGIPMGEVTSTLPVWGLFGRFLLLMVGSLLVVPAPWTGTEFYRFLSVHTVLPGGRRLTFSGQPGDIWLFFVCVAALGLAGMVLPGGGLVTAPITWILTVPILRWFVAKLGTEDGSLRLSFDGKIMGFIGWNLLLYLSFITIIGWAWVMRAMFQWICRNISGTARFEFHGSGGAILWRTLVCGLCSIFLVPIPWIMRWYTVWLVGQFRVVKAGA